MLVEIDTLETVKPGDLNADWYETKMRANPEAAQWETEMTLLPPARPLVSMRDLRRDFNGDAHCPVTQRDRFINISRAGRSHVFSLV